MFGGITKQNVLPIINGISKIFKNLNNKNINILNTENLFLSGSLTILLVYLSPYLIWGQDCFIRISDNLDSNVPWNVIMANNIHRLGWNYDTVTQVMNGVPKAVLGSQFNFIPILYLLFPPFSAYVINLFLIHFAAFFGMLLLLKRINPPSTNTYLLIIYGTALCFALLDFWPSGGLSVAGQPLLLYAFLNFKEKTASFWDYIIIILFPFYSSLVLTGAFIVIVLTVWGVLDSIRTIRNNFQFYTSIALLTVLYLVAEYNLVESWFFKNGFISHRTEFFNAGNSIIETIKGSINLWLYGLSSHANVYQWPVILSLIFIALITILVKKYNDARIFYTLIIITIVLSFISGFYNWGGLMKLKEQFIILKLFDFSRFSWLLPIAFYLLLFYSLQIVAKTIKNSIVIIAICLIIQTGLEFKRNGNNQTLYSKITSFSTFLQRDKQDITYRQYYSEDLFKEVKKNIGMDQSKYRILCLGIDPGVLLYNGFYTLDAYLANYPLRYKHTFRKIIEKELDKNGSIKNVFDNFGSTCYLFSSELMQYHVYTKYDTTKVHNLELNSQQINKLGGNYIVSAIRIKNFMQNNLTLVRTFEDKESLYRIFLYKVL